MLHTKEINHIQAEITLAARTVWSIEGTRHDVISCTKGSLWITQEADLNDYVVEAGKDFWVTKAGRIVIQALNAALFRYSLNELNRNVADIKQPADVQRIQA